MTQSMVKASMTRKAISILLFATTFLTTAYPQNGLPRRGVPIQRDTPNRREVPLQRDTLSYRGIEQTADSLFRAVPPAKKDSVRIPVTAIETNLFMPLMNVGVEVPLGNRFSISADWYYPWCFRSWMNAACGTKNLRCLQGLGGFVMAKVWLGEAHRQNPECDRDRLRGHSLGILLGAGYYDHEKENKSAEAVGKLVPLGVGYQGEAFALALGYGYSLPLGKGGALLEFDIALGYMNTGWWRYGVYDERGVGIRDRSSGRGSKEWWGPVRAGVNIVIPICRKEGCE